jgi:hypothetical protein
MKHEKSPQLRAGCLRGSKSGNKTIPNSKTKNKLETPSGKIKIEMV